MTLPRGPRGPPGPPGPLAGFTKKGSPVTVVERPVVAVRREVLSTQLVELTRPGKHTHNELENHQF